MFQGDECSGGWVSRGMGVPVTDSVYRISDHRNVDGTTTFL